MLAPTDCSRSRPKQTSAARKFPLNSQSKQHARAHIYKQQNQVCPTYLCILNFEGAAARVDVGAVQCVLGSFRWVNAVECELQLRKAKNISLCHPHTPVPLGRALPEPTQIFARSQKTSRVLLGIAYFRQQDKGWPSSLSCPFKLLMKSDTPPKSRSWWIIRVVSSAAALLICQSISQEQGSGRTTTNFQSELTVYSVSSGLDSSIWKIFPAWTAEFVGD
jgi:hypothetical protein